MEAAQKANVMFVDDEKRVLTSMRALFRREYNVHLANSGVEALELLERQDMDVIVSDQRMPGMTGVDVLKACKTRAPRAMRILLTGYADKDAIEASINEGEVFRYLTKPCARDTLRETLALAVDAAGLGAPPSAEPPPLGAGARIDSDSTAGQPSHTLDAGVAPAPAPPPSVAPDVRSAGRRSTLDRVRDTLQRGSAPRQAATELMVLSADPTFTQALEGALGMAYRLHAVGSVEQAIDVLGDNPIGVLITDMAINGDEVQSLTAELKHRVPELVTIVASDHSDAHRLIELINGGQVFRFLLKPIKPKQTAIWIDSAVGKHLELVENPSLLARHAVSAPSDSLFALGDRLLRSIAGRMLRLRSAGSPQGSESS